VEAQEVAVAPLANGRIQTLFVDLFEPVKPGQELALMDDTLIEAELATANGELSRLRANLEAARKRLVLDQAAAEAQMLNDLRRFAMDEEDARLAYLDRVVEQETGKIKLQRLHSLLERQKDLAERNYIAQATYEDRRLRYEALKTELKEDEATLAAAKDHLEAAVHRHGVRKQQAADTALEEILTPLGEEIRVQEARINELAKRRQMLLLKSPVAGTVSSIYHRGGETVLAGDAVLSVVQRDSSRVLAYVDGQANSGIEEGAKVEIIPRRSPTQALKAAVHRVGPRFEEMPVRLRQNPLVPQWGLPVLVGGLPKGVLSPGEEVDVHILADRQKDISVSKGQ
jgi:multidrug resistance efflux pump